MWSDSLLDWCLNTSQYLAFTYSFHVYGAERFPLCSDRLEWIKLLYSSVKHKLCLFSAEWKLIKGHVTTCHRDVQGVSVCVRLRLRVSHECACQWVRRWLGFTAVWGGREVPRQALIPGIINFKPPLWYHSTAALYCTKTLKLCWEVSAVKGAVWHFYQMDGFKSMFTNEKLEGFHDINITLHIR